MKNKNILRTRSHFPLKYDCVGTGLGKYVYVSDSENFFCF